MDTLVQPSLTVEQAALTHQALIAFLNTPEGDLSEDPGEEHLIRQKLSELVYFFSEVVDNPGNFGLRSPEDNKRLLRAVKPVKGPAQPKSNKRKRRQRTRMGYEKLSRKQRRQEAEDYNRARKAMEDEMLESQGDAQRDQEQMVTRFESIARKEVVTNEELQEALELFGAPEAAITRIRELRAADDPQARIDRAASLSIGSRAEGDAR